MKRAMVVWLPEVRRGAMRSYTVNFSWTVHDTRDGRTWSGYGETSFYIPAAADGYNSIDVDVVPTYAFEDGDVLAQVTAQ